MLHKNYDSFSKIYSLVFTMTEHSFYSVIATASLWEIIEITLKHEQEIASIGSKFR